ncbi:hypothetical protein [Brachybacterium aquaticum]|uniref:Uncharacterized protein n=1 Tax=Brachybacterium aquaticum TaxID=1432564 RepID=A0A841AFE5_9MICO|nr:hypothetical protein [Brachybacterium aquaticum]MBB5832703.1 hypothetical protein [Brachybacterium aquaticum]
MTSGAASLPVAGDDRARADLPDLDALRVALGPAELPLRHPRSVREAALRVSDLIHSGRLREARRLAEEFRDVPAPTEDRYALTRAALRGALHTGRADGIQEIAADLVSLLHRAGYSEQAAAVVQVLLERGPLSSGPTGRTRAALATGGGAGVGAPGSALVDASAAASRAASADGVGASAGSRRGRRRGEAITPSAEMLSVVRSLERTALPGDAGEGAGIDPRRAAARLRAALAALPAVRDRLLVDPEPELLLRLAQSLEAIGDRAGATTAVLDVLDLHEDAAADAGEQPRDPSRLVIAAHAVLARTLGIEHPVTAVHHAVEALDSLHEIEDPPLRTGLITSLLQALMAAGDTGRASFTAGRLLSLQRTLDSDEQRIAPLLAVAAQRVQAERYDAAWVPLEQARALAHEHRDHRALLEAARLSASIHERRGDLSGSLGELQRLAFQARWLVDDLDTPRPEQALMLRTELEANALALRRALDLGRSGAVHVAAREIERRTRPDATALLPAEFLWDHLVDARVGVFIAAGEALAQDTDGADEELYERRRREVLEAIGQMPPGHDVRARYWAAYLDDRHAHLLAARDESEAARRAARRARDAYADLGLDGDAARVADLLAGA